MAKVVALCTLAALLAATAGPSSQARLAGDDSWPQWRGHGGVGIGTGTSYPDAWSARERVAWKVEIPGRGHSSSVVWGNRVYVTTSIEGEHLPGRTAPDHLGFDLLPGYARTGRLVYEGGRVPVPATFRASPVAFGDRILLTSEDGDTFVLRAGPVHEILRTNSIDEPVWASPALANGMVYLRGARHLFAIR